jgi:hypothetical protein
VMASHTNLECEITYNFRHYHVRSALCVARQFILTCLKYYRDHGYDNTRGDISKERLTTNILPIVDYSRLIRLCTVVVRAYTIFLYVLYRTELPAKCTILYYIQDDSEVFAGV